jgi:amidase
MTRDFDLLKPATEQLSWLEAGQITSVALLELYIDRYEKLNPALNAIIAVDLDGARSQAREIDKLRAAGAHLGPLAGLPMTVKDVFDVDGLPAVSGAKRLVGRDPNVQDADVVQLVKEAGAIVWGKTNTPMFAGDVQTYNKVYGTTNNPYDLERTPGGSSGGSAAALAAGMTPLEIGSDIGGSLRTPAHNCGICALKPTYGLISGKGHVPPSPGFDGPEADLAVIGPMARTAGDVDLLLSVLAAGSPAGSTPDSVRGLRVARWHEPDFELGRDVAAAVDSAVDLLRDSGATIVDAKPAFTAFHLFDIYTKLLFPVLTEEAPSPLRTLARLARPLVARRAKPGVISRASAFMAGTQSPSSIRTAQRERDHLKDACEAFFDDFDVLVAPVTAVPAIPHLTDKSLYTRFIDVDGDQVPYSVLLEWISLATTCHLPAAVVPIRQTKGGLPMGLQIIGREGDDLKVMGVARAFEVLAGTSDPPLLT